MAMTSVSVMMTVFVLNLHYRGPKKNEIPFWLQQMLSLSVANVVRSFRQKKKTKVSHQNHEEHPTTCSNISERHSTSDRSPMNGILLSYMNTNKPKAKTRTVPDVSVTM